MSTAPAPAPIVETVSVETAPAPLPPAQPSGDVPIWTALWEALGPGLHAVALDAAVAQVATEAAMDGWT